MYGERRNKVGMIQLNEHNNMVGTETNGINLDKASMQLLLYIDHASNTSLMILQSFSLKSHTNHA
jgi:hypothetical protein